MKNNPAHIEENDLEILLRQFVLDGSDDEFTQKTLTMNGEFIFSNAVEIAPDSDSYRKTKEIALIQKLEAEFIKPNRFGRFWLNGIILLVIIISAIMVFKINHENHAGNSPASNHDNNIPAFVPATDTSAEQKKEADLKISPNSFSNLANDSLSFADTVQEQKSSQKEEHYITHISPMPPEPDWYSANYIVPDVPGPTFSAKASPENFKAAQGNFIVRSENVMFFCKQDSFSASYYTGVPFKSGMNDMQYFNLGEYAQTAQVEEKKGNARTQTTLYPWILPWAVLEYTDPDEVKVETVNRAFDNENALFMYKIPEKGIQLATQPFYFRKYEVTNNEYRQFVNWVRASNGYANKPIASCETDTVEITNPNDKEGVQVTKSGKRYRLAGKTTPTEDYKDVYNYVFFNQNSDAVKMLGKTSLYIYPDTASWNSDFTFSYNEPMVNYYFWHPAYDNYPVVGVSWYQATAFLDWKTHMHQHQLNAENIPYEIEYTLPSDIEWELASISTSLGKNMGFHSHEESTEDWLTDLGINYSGHDDSYQRTNYLKNLFTKDQYFRGDYIADGWFHTGPADLSHEKITDKDKGTKHLDPIGISWMDGNVSEWMAESYSQNWKPFFQKHLLVLSADTSESMQLAKQIEMLYDKGNATNGRLVRGANWYDERFGGKPFSDRNEAGISVKRFVDPAEQHSTIGFRYVVHVKRK